MNGAQLNPTMRRVRDVAFRRLMAMPPSVLRRLVGPPVVVEGQTLDLQVQVLLEAMRRVGVDSPDDVEATRWQLDEEAQALARTPAMMARETDVVIPAPSGSIPARVYTPSTAGGAPSLLVYYHGGGFVAGSIASHEPALRDLAHDSGAVIASIEYRRGPEHRFPAAVDDAFEAFRWAHAHAAELGCDPRRVGVGGDSAGGNLAAVVAHLARDAGGPMPALQLLVYPATDWSRSGASHRTFATGFMLEEPRTYWFERHYLNRLEERDDPRVSPVRFARRDGLPRALIVTAGFDILRDEGRAYAEALAEAGTAVDYVCESSLIHGFLSMTGVVDAAHAASRRIAERVRAHFACL